MGSRLDLHTILCDIMGDSKRVYFQPPEDIKMEYPAIVYKYEELQSTHADDTKYITKVKYSIMLIERKPDSPLWITINNLPLSKFIRRYTSSNLYHSVYSIYF